MDPSVNANANGLARTLDGPTNPMVTPLLTDLYQFTMAYAYWKAGKHLEQAVFDLFFRKNPFGGEYTIFAGLEECIQFIANFKFKDEEIAFLRTALPATCEDDFFEYLRGIDCSDVEVHAISEGSVVFPKIPLLRVQGPIAVVQLLETPFVNLVNYASLVATNAARHRFVAGKSKNLLEFGLRRAQGPDGGISASKYCYIGGFDASSNVAAGRLFGIPLRGTHSHAFVSSFMSPDEIVEKALRSSDGSVTCEDFVSLVQSWLNKIQWSNAFRGIFGETNQSELAAFTSYALAFPNNFLALVDTYDVMRSGVPNFSAVALALSDLGYKAAGIRLDSGDLAYLSIESRRFFCAIEKEFSVTGFGKTTITASNDLNEETLDALNKQGHEVDAFGIGTYLVTCYAQAALGCVFKLVEINNQPRIKLSEDVSKVSIPCKKRCYRLFGREGYPLVDIMTGENEPPPKVAERILCRHPFNESKRAYVVPQCVEELLKCYWPGSSDKKREELPPLKKIRERCIQQLSQMRPDHMRRLNPTPYKVSVRGIYAGKHIQFGNKVSEDGGNKSRRTWKPNVQEKRLFSYILDRYIRVKVTMHALRCIDKAGGIDEYLLKTPYHKMDTEMGLFWKAKIEKMYEELGMIEVGFFPPEEEAKLEQGFQELKLARKDARREARRAASGGSKQKQIDEGNGEEKQDGKQLEQEPSTS